MRNTMRPLDGNRVPSIANAAQDAPMATPRVPVAIHTAAASGTPVATTLADPVPHPPTHTAATSSDTSVGATAVDGAPVHASTGSTQGESGRTRDTLREHLARGNWTRGRCARAPLARAGGSTASWVHARARAAQHGEKALRDDRLRHRRPTEGNTPGRCGPVVDCATGMVESGWVRASGTRRTETLQGYRLGITMLYAHVARMALN